MDNELKVEFCERDYIESDNGKLWFINVGLLNNTAFRNVIEGLEDFNFSDAEMIKIVAITAIYLTSDLELIAHRVTPLIRDCLEKRFTFLVKLGETYDIVNYFYRASFATTLMNVFDCLEELTKEPYADIDILNPIAKGLVYLEALTFDMRQNPWLDRWLKINGYCPNKYGVHYHCFMIPIHPSTYIKQFTRRDDETFLDKIEYYCFCKLQLSENVACFYRNEFYMVECIFDVYKGRYLGLLDMLQYICKNLNATKYEIKHLLTLAKTGEDKFESINSFDKDTLLALANSNPNEQGKQEQNANSDHFDNHIEKQLKSPLPVRIQSYSIDSSYISSDRSNLDQTSQIKASPLPTMTGSTVTHFNQNNIMKSSSKRSHSRRKLKTQNTNNQKPQEYKDLIYFRT